MNYAQNGARYREAAIMGSSPQQLVVVLYDHLLASLRRADKELKNNNVEARADALGKASDILFELMASLDHDVGGELSQRLSALYAYILSEITTVNRTRDEKKLSHITSIVQTLHTSWSEAARQVAAQ